MNTKLYSICYTTDMEDCIFCKIANHKTSSDIQFEDNSVVVFPSIKPAAETHLLIIPKKHIKNFLEIDNSEILFNMTKAVHELIKVKKIEDGYKLILNGGKYQSVPHIHWHLLAGKLEDEDDILNQT